MTVYLTPEQEQRVEAILHCGAYQTIEDFVEAALAAMEQRAASGFDGSNEELEALLAAGQNSAEIPEDEFWASVDQTTNAMHADHKASSRR